VPRRAQVNPFTLLVCVALNDQMKDMGNFRAAAGSHVPVSSATKEFFSETGQFDNNKKGISFAKWKHGRLATAVDEPQPLLLRAGDVAICHSKLAHRRGHNASPVRASSPA
jgi:ectoine hydroxylase-related dioxygenase (phytanoyl-CoA dioxygenase family)